MREISMSAKKRRPGPGAPRNNLNALKDGATSRQLRRALISAEPQEWELLISRLKDKKTRARVLLVAAILLGRFRRSKMPKTLSVWPRY